MYRTAAAKIGGMDRQTLRDWVHRFNERGPDGLKDNWRRDVPSRLSAAQLSRWEAYANDDAIPLACAWPQAAGQGIRPVAAE